MEGDFYKLEIKINTTRDKLHKKLESGASDKDEILKISCELDKHIVEYYKIENISS